MEGFQQCSNRSVGTASQIFSQVIQTILSAQCAIDSTNLWPEDYGPIITERGFSFHTLI